MRSPESSGAVANQLPQNGDTPADFRALCSLRLESFAGSPLDPPDALMASAGVAKPTIYDRMIQPYERPLS